MGCRSVGHYCGVVRFERSTQIELPIDEVFDLALSIDVHASSFADSDERAIDGVTSGTIGQGEFVTWRAKHFGIWWTMTNVITEWDRPHRFVDQQRRGPFKSFRHEHRFAPAGEEQRATVMHDEVCFRAPLGVLGRLVERLVLARYLAGLIDTRNEFIRTEAGRR